jgi:hypothetical protein
MSAAAAAQAQKPAKTEGRFAGRDKEKDVRTSNCLAARGTNFYHHFLILPTPTLTIAFVYN